MLTVKEKVQMSKQTLIKVFNMFHDVLFAY